jgi:hypothetical protein
LALALLLGSRAPLRRRIISAVTFFFLSALPLIVWLVRNSLVYGAPSEKTLGLHPPGLDAAIQAFRTIGNWVAPGGIVALVCGIVIVSVVALLGRRTLIAPLKNDNGTIALMCASVSVTYLVFVIGSRTLLDQNIPLDARILAPIQVLAVIWICSAIRPERRPDRTGRARIAAVALAVLAAFTFVRGALTVGDFSGLDVTSYTNDRWRASDTLEYIGTVPERTMIISNAVDAIWFWHDRPTQLIPSRENLYSGNLNEKYPEHVQKLLAATACREAIVAFFNKPTRKPRRIIEQRLVIELGLEPLERFADGIVYTVREPRVDCA